MELSGYNEPLQAEEEEYHEDIQLEPFDVLELLDFLSLSDIKMDKVLLKPQEIRQIKNFARFLITQREEEQ